ncbi:hypothetical protein IWZ01DRAFT_171824 [Phyllosticta capitalensis]
MLRTPHRGGRSFLYTPYFQCSWACGAIPGKSSDCQLWRWQGPRDICLRMTGNLRVLVMCFAWSLGICLGLAASASRIGGGDGSIKAVAVLGFELFDRRQRSCLIERQQTRLCTAASSRQFPGRLGELFRCSWRLCLRLAGRTTRSGRESGAVEVQSSSRGQ